MEQITSKEFKTPIEIALGIDENGKRKILKKKA